VGEEIVSDDPKSFHLSPEVHRYIVEHGTPPDEILEGLIAATKELGGLSIMQIAPEQGAFMTLLARITGARLAVEVGTFTGFSALCLARGLGEGGRLVACDVSEEWAAVGRPFWEKAGRPGGLILVDNVLWMGRVADASIDDEHTETMRAFNDFVAADKRVDCVMLAISDGLTLLRKR
jgi:predicted O-methyltransferase YrrM